MFIGVAGRKRHGKDTVAHYLSDKYGFHKMAFADNLKSVCGRIFPEIDFLDEATKETPFKEVVSTTPEQLSKLFYLLDSNYALQTYRVLDAALNLWMAKSFTSVRDILQFVGTNILRDLIDADYHYNTVAKVFRKIESADYIHPVRGGVVSDVRFLNERINLQKDFSAKLILVKRPSLEDNATSSHASETSLGEDSEYDYVVINGGTLEDLYAKIDDIMDELTLKVSGA
jgi:hypothetical protein